MDILIKFFVAFCGEDHGWGCERQAAGKAKDEALLNLLALCFVSRIHLHSGSAECYNLNRSKPASPELSEPWLRLLLLERCKQLAPVSWPPKYGPAHSVFAERPDAPNRRGKTLQKLSRAGATCQRCSQYS